MRLQLNTVFDRLMAETNEEEDLEGVGFSERERERERVRLIGDKIYCSEIFQVKSAVSSGMGRPGVT